MKKFWVIYTRAKNDPRFEYSTYQEAEEAAKRKAANDGDNEYIVLEAVAAPKIDVVKLVVE